jgi:hypothetical protein
MNPLRAIEAGQHGTGIRASLSWSYDMLNPQAARLFVLLGVHPDTDVDSEGASRLTGTTVDEARALLADLAGLSVLSEYAPGRYTMHGLTQAYAAELFHAGNMVTEG